MAIEDAPLSDEYVTVTYGLRGFFAVHVTLTEDEFGKYYVPEQSHPSSYKTRQEAIPAALYWAKAYDIPFQLEGYDALGNPTN